MFECARTMIRPALVALVLLLPAGLLQANLVPIPNAVQEQMPQARLVGAAPYRYLLWDVYDIALYAPRGDYRDDGWFALAIAYKRDFTGKAIADRSTGLMRELGCGDEYRLAGWNGLMKELFPDVAPGVVLTGVHQPNGESWFYRDGELLGKVRDPQFGRCFFHIWLGEKTPEPSLRAALLGQR